MWKWARYHDDGFEVSSRGNTAYSPLFAKLADGRTLEEAYQLDVKGYRAKGYTHWVQAKGKSPVASGVDLWEGYLTLWKQWADENPGELAALARKAKGKVLTDCHATGPINQAHALAVLLNARHPT